MMINKRLINTVSESKKYIAANVLFQWISLVANIVMMAAIACLLGNLMVRQQWDNNCTATVIIAVISIIIRFACHILSSNMSYLSSKAVKKKLREMIYKKLLRLGASYKENVQTSEIVQVAVEGVEQLETYFGSYLPQFFYAMLAPVTLFFVISFVNITAAVVLLVCVPLIPVTIIVIQRWAKRLLAKYWGQYTALGDNFLENLQGLTTLKIYQADSFKNDEMNEEAEKFRKITMKVLTMQLNSITIMDLIAYGGAALGIIIAVLQCERGNISAAGALFIVLLSADFFLPMRQLGSFFHVAMNGMAASDKIFKLLDLPEEKRMEEKIEDGNSSILCRNLSFSYDGEREILRDINMEIKKGSFISIVGESGCGKSTIASILMKKNKVYKGSVLIGDKELSRIDEESILKNFTYISYQSYLFKGTVRDNLRMGNKNASELDMWEALRRVKLDDFLESENGLDTVLLEKGANFSGGQRQRLALARALLHDSMVYIFDEATSNIDVESEDAIMEEIYRLAKEKTVILISHRLANVTESERIYVMDGGKIAESGTHEKLLEKNKVYAGLWNTQQSLENLIREEM